jgi:hypothetical protein
MSIFKSKPLYTWSADAQLAADALFTEVASWPGVAVASELRRPAAMCGTVLIIAAHESGLAFRAAGIVGPEAHGLAVTGMTYLPESHADDWPWAAKLAFDQAQEG